MAPADVAAHVQTRVKRIAEQAFWDAVQASLAQSGGDDSQQKVTGQLAGLLAHLGQDLLAVLPEQAGAARERLAAELAEDRLQDALTAHQVSLLCCAALCCAVLCYGTLQPVMLCSRVQCRCCAVVSCAALSACAQYGTSCSVLACTV